MLVVVFASGGSVYARPEYHHLMDAARAHREGWGKGRAEALQTFTLSLAADLCKALADEAGDPRGPETPGSVLIRPSAPDRTLLRPPINPSSLPS